MSGLTAQQVAELRDRLERMTRALSVEAQVRVDVEEYTAAGQLRARADAYRHALQMLDEITGRP